VCLPVNDLNSELDAVRKQINEKADEVNRLQHEREGHQIDLENIVHEINSKYCVVCRVWSSTLVLSAAGSMSDLSTLSGCIWFSLALFLLLGGGGGGESSKRVGCVHAIRVVLISASIW
jgi:hypothetical protein